MYADVQQGLLFALKHFWDDWLGHTSFLQFQKHFLEGFSPSHPTQIKDLRLKVAVSFTDYEE